MRVRVRSKSKTPIDQKLERDRCKGVMARANLSVSDEVSEAFLAATAIGSSTRLIKVGISDEKLVLVGQGGGRVGTAEEDFAGVLAASVSETEAALLLFSLTESGTGTPNNSWLFCLWIPDGCRVRDKMLYSSSKEDLKRSLGQGYFTQEYYASLRDDLTWASSEASKKVRSADIMSEQERSVFEERIASHAESNATRATAMGVLPFQVAPELRSGIEDFKNSKCTWCAMTIVGETVSLVGTKIVGDLATTGTSLQSHVSDTEAQFILTKHSNPAGEKLSFFIFACPESVPIRTKMVMSSAKATVLAIVAESGVTFDRNIEIRSPVDIDDIIKAELEPETLGASSASAAIAHSKPTRPGQKSRSSKPVAKFVASEE